MRKSVASTGMVQPAGVALAGEQARPCPVSTPAHEAGVGNQYGAADHAKSAAAMEERTNK